MDSNCYVRFWPNVVSITKSALWEIKVGKDFLKFGIRVQLVKLMTGLDYVAR